MKILHLFSDWKWTGPAEPTVSLCEALTREGADVTLAYRKTPLDFPERTVEKEVARREIIKGFDGLRLNRYFSPRDWLHDLRMLKSYVARHSIDVVHTNLSHDHYTALLSFSFARKRPLIIRTDHKRDGLPRDPFMFRAFKQTDGLVTYSRTIMNHDIKEFGFPADRTCIIPPGVRIYDGPVVDMRAEFGVNPDEKIIGVIGRLKPDRGYDVILRAFKLLKERMGKVKLVIVGRSSQIEKSIMEPVKLLGLEKDVIIAGYRLEDYFSTIWTFDLFIMMRAGSDGTARALREVAAMGKPAIVSDKGMLPELIKDGMSGYVARGDERDLAEKMERILGDEGLRQTMGECGRKMAVEEWSYPAQARKLIEFYEKLVKQGPRKV